MSFFKKSKKKDLPEDRGNLLFPHHNSAGEHSDTGSDAVLHDGVITFPNVPGAIDAPVGIKKPA